MSKQEAKTNVRVVRVPGRPLVSFGRWNKMTEWRLWTVNEFLAKIEVKSRN